MAGARFVFISDGTGAGSECDESDQVWWRLVAANNRVLGRLVGTARGEAACRAGAAELIARLGDAVADVTMDKSGRWRWALWLDGAELAEGAHPFLRRVDCARTLALFSDGIGSAEPYAGAVRYLSSGRYLPRPPSRAVSPAVGQ